jgi:CheY-like chemotaxis protein
VRFDVRDTGIGIDPEKQARLFEPFVQADGSIARSFGGTGLGLSICKRLAEMMGGEIGLQTQPGIGSSFWFTARFARVRENPAPRRKAFSQVRALVLSRDQTFRYVVRQYLWAWSVPSYHEFEPRGITQRLARPDDAVWVAIVDRDDVDADLIAAMQASGVIGPERVVMVSHDIELRKPIHAASLYAAITNAIEAAPRPALAPIRASLPEPPPRLAGRVLVAEDNVTLQRLMKLQFDALGVPVTFVSDGREAVDAVRDHRFPIVFMDCHMPVMDGLAAAREIRASVHGEHVPVIIAMTANALAEDRAACTAAGMDDYLPKPVLLGALRDMLARWAHAPVGVR